MSDETPVSPMDDPDAVPDHITVDDLVPLYHDVEQDHLLSNRVYTVLKYVVTVFIPGLIAALFALSAFVHIPNLVDIIGILGVVGTFIGGLIHVSTKSYNNSTAQYDGDAVVTNINSPHLPTGVSLELNGDPHLALATKKALTFKVVTPKEQVRKKVAAAKKSTPKKKL